MNEDKEKIKKAIKEILKIIDMPLAESMVMLKLSFITDEQVEKSVAVIKKYF